MFQLTSQTHTPHAPQGFFAAFAPLRVTAASPVRLGAGSEGEVLSFLSERPAHAVNLISLIGDNGLVSPLNRGTFYGCRDEAGRLEGIALIGHATLFEARTPRALRAIARAAQRASGLHMVLGESEPVAEFWQRYCAGEHQPMRLACRELMFELDHDDAAAATVPAPTSMPRRATLEDLPLVMPVQAQMIEDESGINPLVSDPEGFRRRCERRIGLGRTLVVTQGKQLVFKTEVIAETKQVVYLEGIYVAPGERGRGQGRRCLSWLAGEILRYTDSICVLVNEQNVVAQALYRKAGFRFVCNYDTIFLRQD
jgi:predicted GNAT family acetyltransferase